MTRSRAVAATGLLVVLGMAAATVAAGLAPASAGATPPRGDKPHTREATIRVATYNVEQSMTNRQVLKDLRALDRRDVSVIGLQEMGNADRRAAVQRKFLDCPDCHFDGYLPAAGPAAQNPVLYRSGRFRLIESGAVKVTDRTRVGKRGAGPAVAPAKYVDYVGLREQRSHRRVYVLNNHLIASVQAKGGASNPTMEKRLEVYRKHMRGLRGLVTSIKDRKLPVVVTGDFNVNYRRDKVVQDPIFPYVNMHKVGARASYEELGEPKLGTHTLPNGNDTRLIDYVYQVPHTGVTMDRQHVLTGFHSDHRPLLVRFRLTPHHR